MKVIAILFLITIVKSLPFFRPTDLINEQVPFDESEAPEPKRFSRVNSSVAFRKCNSPRARARNRERVKIRSRKSQRIRTNLYQETQRQQEGGSGAGAGRMQRGWPKFEDKLETVTTGWTRSEGKREGLEADRDG